MIKQKANTAGLDANMYSINMEGTKHIWDGQLFSFGNFQIGKKPLCSCFNP